MGFTGQRQEVEGWGDGVIILKGCVFGACYLKKTNKKTKKRFEDQSTTAKSDESDSTMKILSRKQPQTCSVPVVLCCGAVLKN